MEVPLSNRYQSINLRTFDHTLPWAERLAVGAHRFFQPRRPAVVLASPGERKAIEHDDDDENNNGKRMIFLIVLVVVVVRSAGEESKRSRRRRRERKRNT